MGVQCYLECVWIPLTTENWKHGNKIIFKYVNSIMGFSFEVVFVENSTCMSHEQCTRPTTKCGMELKSAFQHYPNIHLRSVWIPHITKNWKHCSKIIFKCVNSTVRPSFKVVFVKKSTYGSREQYMTHQKTLGARRAIPTIT